MNEVQVTCDFLLQLCRFAQIPEWTIAGIEDIEATVVSLIDEVNYFIFYLIKKI